MEMTISKTYSETVSRNYQTWKYTTTLTKSINVDSAESLQKESEKLWKQVKLLTQKDIERDHGHRAKAIDSANSGDDY